MLKINLLIEEVNLLIKANHLNLKYKYNILEDLKNISQEELGIQAMLLEKIASIQGMPVEKFVMYEEFLKKLREKKFKKEMLKNGSA